jgi:hypothetical protein
MRALMKISVVTAAITVLALAGQGAVAGAVAAAGARAAGPGSGCSTVRTPTGWQVICDNSSGKPGVPGNPGGSGSPGGSGGPAYAIRTTCTLAPPGAMTPPYPAPAGQVWMRTACTSIGLYGTAAAPGGLVLVPTGSTAAAPGISPQQVLQMALAQLNPPAPAVSTAPPRGRDALVGLPEWFWITNWHPIHIGLAVGGVGANVTAVPDRLTFSPGGGLPAVSCRGPGRPYNRKRPASVQHSACSYTYRQSSAQQPGGAYTASVSVTWAATWTTSDGAGGAVNPPLQVQTTFALPVAEGQALVNTP